MNHSLSYYKDAKNLGGKILIYRLQLYLTLNFCLDYITDYIHTRLENSWMKKTNQNNDQIYFGKYIFNS